MSLQIEDCKQDSALEVDKNVRTVVHDGGGDPLAGEAQRPRRLHVQVQFGHAARLTCVVLKNNTLSFIIY